MIFQIDSPRLVFVSTSGQEFYLSPLTNEVTTRAIAYSDSEYMKNLAVKKSYSNKQSQNKLKVHLKENLCSLKTLKKDGFTKVIKPNNLFYKNSLDINKSKRTNPGISKLYTMQEEFFIKDLPVIPFLFYIIRTLFNFIVFGEEDPLLEDDEFESNSSFSGKNKKSRNNNKKLLLNC